MKTESFVPNMTSAFFKNLCKILYYCGLPNLWVDVIESTVIFSYFIKTITVCFVLLMICEWLSYLTQHDLSEKQESDRTIFCFSHPILFSYYVNAVYYQDDLKALMYKLSVTLKRNYTDTDVERAFMKKAIISDFLYSFTIVSALVSYGFNGIVKTIRSEGTFTTVITVWPQIADEGVPAFMMRIVWCFLWCAFVTRISAGYLVVLSILIALDHQYKNLKSYFNSLNDIFDKDSSDSVTSRERKVKDYEEALIIGIKLHAETLWCTEQCQRTCGVVFSGQIMMNIGVLCLLMLQMVGSERSLISALSIVVTFTAVLASLAFIMWSAGDITVEASLLPDAIYFSGWHNCPDAVAGRVKKLLVSAISQSQKPVALISFGVIELSYQSFLTIVKSTYSVFSLLY